MRSPTIELTLRLLMDPVRIWASFTDMELTWAVLIDPVVKLKLAAWRELISMVLNEIVSKAIWLA
jgi:hypothetical protein